MTSPDNFPTSDTRNAMELAQTAQARFETTEAAAENYELDLERIKACDKAILDHIHRGPHQENALWVVEISQAMLTAVMAVNKEPLPVSEQVDPASYALSVLRDMATDAKAKGMSWEELEATAAQCLRLADGQEYTHLETFWALNRATASLELAWARDLAQEDG